MAEAGASTPKGKSTKRGGKDEEVIGTPGPKKFVRSEKFFAYDWSKLPVKMLHAFMLACGD